MKDIEAFWIVLELARQNILPAEHSAFEHAQQVEAIDLVKQIAIKWQTERELEHTPR